MIKNCYNVFKGDGMVHDTIDMIFIMEVILWKFAS